MHYQWPEEAVGGRGAYYQELCTPKGEMQDMMHPCRRESSYTNAPLQDAGKICTPAGEMQDIHPCRRETEDSTAHSHTGQRGQKGCTTRGSMTQVPFKRRV